MPRSRLKITEISNPGSFKGRMADGTLFSAAFDLWLIRAAWEKGLDLEKEADGYGRGMGTMGDWSGIRDSSPGARAEMLEKTFIFLGIDR